MPELELLEACPEERRFREENHGPQDVALWPRQPGSNPSVGSLEPAWNRLAKAGCITSARVCRKPHERSLLY